MKSVFVWVLLVTTPDGHDSPDMVSVHISAYGALVEAEDENLKMYTDHETPQGITWHEINDDGSRDGEGVGYRYRITREAIRGLA